MTGFGRARLSTIWVTVRDSLWFLPGTMSLAAVVLSYVALGIDRSGSRAGSHLSWLYEGGVEGARAVLSVIAGSLITVTGVIFSVTIVALQLASTQFTPRILRSFTANRGNQLVMGVFIGTFTYTLLVLRAVRSAPDDGESFVPSVAVAGAIVLLLVSIGFLIFFVHHAARSIQASFILETVTRHSVAAIASQQIATESARRFEDPSAKPVHVLSRSGGYMQNIDEPALLRLIEDHDLTMRMHCKVGDYVMTGEPVASVWYRGGTVDAEGMKEQVRSAVMLGMERTPEQDIEYGIIEISDIAVKALSPGINDPTTAMHCIDHLGEVLAYFGNCPVGDERNFEVDGVVRLTRPLTTYDFAVELAFDQIRHFGSDNPVIVRCAVDMLARLENLVPPHRRIPIRRQLLLFQQAAATA